MKNRLTLIVAGLIAGVAATSSHAGCASSCPPGACRYEAAGNYFYCTAVRSKSPGAAVGPRASSTASSSVVQKGPAVNSATATGPKTKPQKQTAIKSPRDAASGQATGRRTYKP